MVDWTTLSQFHLLRPGWLVLLLPLVWGYRRLRASRGAMGRWSGLLSSEMLAAMTVPGDRFRARAPRRLWLCQFMLLILALSGPSWYRTEAPMASDRSLLVIALKLSESMQATDLSPTRLVRAKQKIVELMRRRGDGQTALVAYAGSAHLAMPATDDRRMMWHLLDALDPKVMPSEGDRPAGVLPLAEELFSHNGEPATLLLITDDVPSEALRPFEAHLAGGPHRLLLWQVADPGRIAPESQRRLSSLAEIAGGELVPFAHDDGDIEQILGELGVQMRRSGNSEQPWYDAGYLLLWLQLPLGLLWFRRGWRL
ncbi:VWA domain-containing protein [Ferrimonas sediminicola]|uniref:VWA domain-containing protein n=1 Tax=Ferrimonas sediminicola TaxID=2569538 RepID=A0A4U1BBL0_9GAMM|nr:VWA domain-containing protein [Ferrimonas sediminicola]TKB48171.1 VWA domain-containing protein [Ferrimonas sediminicola]